MVGGFVCPTLLGPTWLLYDGSKLRFDIAPCSLAYLLATEHLERHCSVAVCSQEKASGVYVRCSCGATFPSFAVVSGTICARISLTLRGESLGIRAQREYAEHAKQAKDVERDERRARVR